MFWSSFTNLRSRLFKLPSACPQKYEILNLKFKRFGGLFAHLWIQIFDFIISRHLYIIIQIQDVDIKRADPSKKNLKQRTIKKTFNKLQIYGKK